MKRFFALLLCGVLLLTLSVGCKKNSSPVIELNEARYIADLANNDAKYSYSYAEGKPTISDFTIVEKKEDGGMTTLSVTATASNDHVDIELAATMEYVRENNYWRLSKLEITKAEPIPTSAPDITTLRETLRNYTTITGSALAIMDEEHYHLEFNVDHVTFGTSFNSKEKTARLMATLKSDRLSFTGHYNLTFAERGWVLESEKQENGSHYPLLYLDTLEQKEDKK